MAVRKVTLSLDPVAFEMAERAAAAAGLSTSAWISAAARREAVRAGAGTRWGDDDADARADEADRAVVETDLDATG